jgi:hypothetical protein
MALLLSVFGIIAIKVNVVELLIPITILITALFNLLQQNPVKENYKFGFITLFFGIIHGLGFQIISNRFWEVMQPQNTTAIRVCIGY